MGTMFCGGWTVYNDTPNIVQIENVEHWCNDWLNPTVRTVCLDYRNNAYTREILPGKKLDIDKLLVWHSLKLTDGDTYYFAGERPGEKFESVHIPDSQHWTLRIKEKERK